MYNNRSSKQLVMGGTRTNQTQPLSDYAEVDPSARYARLDEVLGKGAVKTVYKAIDQVLGIEVAWNQVQIKDVIHSKQELNRLNSEVHLLSTLNHDSVIKFYTSWIDTNQMTFNVITELFTSGTLRQYREKYRRVDIQAIKRWSRQILQGLVYLHGHDPPVIHRDLKCDNIFVNGHVGQVKIGDLGLAALLSGSKSAHSILGTPEFMAPELYEEDYNELVDVYSFGMCMLEMLTLEYPYNECANPAQIYKKVTSGKLPAALYQIQDYEAQRFIKKCLAPAAERFSARDLLLDPFLSSVDGGSLHTKIIENEESFQNLKLYDSLPRTNMTITGKLKPKDGTVFLKVKFSEVNGPARNIFFPYDMVSDTPMKVAMEMVEELEITDWDPHEIAEMIEAEISILMPNWKIWLSTRSHPYNSSDNKEDDYDDAHLYYSSSCSSLASLSRVLSSQESDPIQYFQEDIPDDISSHSSTLSERTNSSYSAYDDIQGVTVSKSKCLRDRHHLTRNHSYVDVQRQSLHREDVIKKRLSKTVGAVEHIGFQSPYELSTSQHRDKKKQGKTVVDKTQNSLPYK